MKKGTVLALAAAAVLCAALTALSPGPEAFAYDKNWQTDESGNWSYIMNDGSRAASAWVHDVSDGNWYLLDENGIMRTGFIKSYGKYYMLDTVRGSGSYGKLLKNGDKYLGILIYASTAAEDEGALSDHTLKALEAQGYNYRTAPSVTGTKHISGGVVTREAGEVPVNSSSDSVISQVRGTFSVYGYDAVEVRPNRVIFHPMKWDRFGDGIYMDNATLLETTELDGYADGDTVMSWLSRLADPSTESSIAGVFDVAAKGKHVDKVYGFYWKK